MKKTVRIAFVMMFVLGIILASAPNYAIAKSDSDSSGTPNALIAGGSWTTGTTTDVTALVGSAPAWLQWLANGVKVSEAGKICHPFRGGQFGWVGQIMQYKNGEWVKLPTSDDWVPNKEGQFMSCAQAPAAGTYALFGYWKRPVSFAVEEPGPSCSYSTAEWTATWEDFNENAYKNIIINNLTLLDDTVLTFTRGILTGLIEGVPASDSATIIKGTASFSDTISEDGGSVSFTVSALGCSKAFTLPN